MAVPSPFQYAPGGSNPFTPISEFQGIPTAAPAHAVAPQQQVAAPAPVVATPTTTQPTQQQQHTQLSKYAPAAYAGLTAAQPAANAYDTKSGIISTLGAGASGAATGAVVGGPVGALIGGGTGLLLGGLNAYLSVGAKNKAKRDQNRLLREAEAKQATRDKIARDDAVSQLAYDRKEAARQKQWAKNLQIRQALHDAAAGDKTADAEFIATGRV